MEREITTLADIHRVATAKGSGYFGPVRCCIVGFVAENEFPKRFVYRGCTERKPRGICKVSLEGPESKHCEHNALARGSYTHYFRFELALSDESLLPTYGKMGMRASIWEAATSILNVTPVNMAGLDEAEQFKLLYDCLKDIPLCDIDFRVTNGDISITELEIVSLSSTLPQCRSWKSPYGTPRRRKGFSEVGTPEKPPVSRLGTSSTPTKCSGFVTPTKQLAAPSSTTGGEISVEGGSSDAVEKPRGLSSVVRDLAGALSSSLDFYSGSR